MKSGGSKIPWSVIGKLIAGLAMIVISFLIFKSAQNWVKVIVLAALVVVLIAPQHLLKKKLPPEIEKAIKGDDRKGPVK